MYLVYRIKNKANGKSYIGITARSIKDRFEEHLSRARCGQRNSRLYDAIRKYGPNGFTVEKIAEALSEKDTRKLETVYINNFDSYNNGYNCNLGGCGWLEIPQKIKKKISEAQIGKVISSETRENMSLAKLGDKRCAKHFGDYIQKGAKNPKAESFLIQHPDGHTEIVKGLRAFCRKHKIHQCGMTTRGKSKGFVLLERFNDHPEREYAQAGGSAHLPYGVEDMI